jgi:hypothetical protein
MGAVLIYMRTDGQMDVTNLVSAFCDYAQVFKNEIL